MLARAGGKCEICRIPAQEATRGKLFIDHDHNYGVFAIRGLICNRCNLLVRKVEQGEKTDIRVTAYIANAWFMWRLVNPPGRPGPLKDPRVFGGWERPAQALRKAGLRP